MSTPTTRPHHLARLVTVVAAAVLVAVPHVVQAAPKSGSGGGKGKTTSSSALDIATSVSDLADPVRLGQEVTYRTVVSNLGTATTHDLPVRISVEEGHSYETDLVGAVIYSSVTPSQGSCSMSRHGAGFDLPLPDHSDVGLVVIGDSWLFDGVSVRRGSFPVCDLGALAPGETATIDVVVRPTYPSRYSPYLEGERPSLTARAQHGLTDSNHVNDYDFERTTVTTGSDPADCVLTGAGVVGWTPRLSAPCAGLD